MEYHHEMVEMQAVVYMFCAFALLWISFYLMRRLSDMQISSWSKSQLINHATSTVTDMGIQLYNLTAIRDNLAPGYVYVVKSDTGHYKIGRTSDYKNRARTFNVKLPVEIKFIILIQTGNMNTLETTFHRMFRHKRVNGEWFQLSMGDLIWLQNYPGNLLSSDDDTEPVEAVA